MDKNTCTALLRHYQQVYGKAKKKGKKDILTILTDLTGYDRKYLTRRLAQKIPAKMRIYHRHTPSRYASVFKIIKTLWIYGKFPCSTRLIVMMPMYIDALERFQELLLTTE